jgi:tetratricopeptide (TPR) repeat protein
MMSDCATIRNGLLIILFWITSGFFQTTSANVCEKTVAQALSVQGRVERLTEEGTQWGPVKLNDQFCPGVRIRVGKNSRVSLIINKITLVRLAENSSVRIDKQEEDGGAWLNLIEGVTHFISRVRNQFQVNTPYVNATVEGTEFTVESTDNSAVVTVLEGRVRANNAWGEILIKDGQKAVAYAGEAPRLEQVVDPIDAVQWTLYYPPLYEIDSGAGRKAFEAYRRGDIEGAFASLAQSLGVEQDPIMLVQRATLYLQVGKVDNALRDLKMALHQDASQADALALMSIIATVQSRREQALELAQRAINNNSRGLSPLLALSYARQAQFQLPEALAATQQATEFYPDSALAWSQRARLHLMFRELDEANFAAKRAVAIAPESAQTLTTLGFVHLIRLDLDQARQAFEQAIRFDQSAAPLPRLGLGLLEIREGNMVEGRQQLEIAANLDPGNAMIRSYLGKAYYEEVRDKQASTQFALAKKFDELDPTPWFYNAILRYSENRIVEALDELQNAIELNDNRAVYRSRFLLDQDGAVRNVTKARIYQDLDFKELVRREAYKSLQTSAYNHSAHRLLADSYKCVPKLVRATRSELLQSQLLQPLNGIPNHSGLTAGKLGNSDCTTSGFSEYSSLFIRNGLNLHLNAGGGSNNAVFNNLVLSGLHNRIAFSLGQYHYRTDFSLEDSDSELNIYKAFVQADITPSTSIQFEYTQSDSDRRYPILNSANEPGELDNRVRVEPKRQLGRVGLHHQFNSNGHLIASIVENDLMDSSSLLSSVYDPNYPLSDGSESPAIVDHLYTNSFDGDSTTMELQYIQPLHDHTFTLGVSHHVDDIKKTRFRQPIVNLLTQSPPYVHTYPFPVEQLDRVGIDTQFSNIYLYSQIALPAKLNLTLGIAHENYDLSLYETEQTNPKFGLTWKALDSLAFRAAYLEKIAPPPYMYQRIEPTQVAGFNQVHDIEGGYEIEQYGFGVDATLSKTLGLLIEHTKRDFESSDYQFDLSEDSYPSFDEELTHVNLHWIATKRLAMHISYKKNDFTKSADASDDAVTMRYTDIGLNYRWTPRLLFRFLGSRIEQEIIRCCVETLQDKVWQLDTLVEYQLPKRLGKVSFVVKNLLDKSAQFYDINSDSEYTMSPSFTSERQLFGQFSLDF